MRFGVAFPLQLDDSGSAATAPTRSAATEQLIEELLFTAHGERLNQPGLGCGLLGVVFDAATDDLRAATQFQVKTQLQRWLGDVVQIASVTLVGSGPASISIAVTYALPPGGAPQVAVFSR